MKQGFLLLATLCGLLAQAVRAQQVVPESPAIWREVTGVVNTYPAGPGTTAVPVFTRPHQLAFRTSDDGRVAGLVETGGVNGTIPAFSLNVPEKLTQPFLLNAPGTNTMSRPGFTRLNVANRFGTPALDHFNFTDGVRKPAHACIWDPGSNPQVVGGEDVYDLKVLVTTNSKGQTQLFVTPVRITVSNPKTINAVIRLVEKTGPAVAGPLFPFPASGFEPVISGDGRLLLLRIESAGMPWTDPVTGAVHNAQGVDIVYSYYETGEAADPTKWTTLIPITHAPYDPRINAKFGFALTPFRDPAGTIIPDGEDLGGSYPWIDREARNLFFAPLNDQLHFLADGSWNHSRYPQRAVPGETAVYQGEAETKTQGLALLGLWSQGKMVLLDTPNNDMDYAIGTGDTGPGPQSRLVSLFLPQSGPLGTETGELLLGYGRATKRMPAGENDNGTIVDSFENRFNFRQHAVPLSHGDIVWPLANSRQSDEVVFDDYLDPDAFIIANMAGLVTVEVAAELASTAPNLMLHHTGWDPAAHAFSLPVRLQNAATTTSDHWIVPAHGLVIGHGRVEPAATGGVHGRGFWMDGSIGLEFTVTPQPQAVANADWYVGLFVDCRFADDASERRLLTFPDGTAISLYGRSQLLYLDAAQNILSRITLPTPDRSAPASVSDDLLPDTGWAHLAFQVRQGGKSVDFLLNGLVFNRWVDGKRALFQMNAGKLTVGKDSSRPAAGFAGWIDDFKVFAHGVDPETACNYANGSLIGLSATYAGPWKTKFADRYPAWAQAEISALLRNQGEAAYPQYACFYHHGVDRGANRSNLPSGTVALRQSVHAPEGPLFYNRPRPDTETNVFCLTCHHDQGKLGLNTAALELDSAFTAARDPRRQPLEPPQRIFGRIPAKLVDSTALPAALTDLSSTGKYIDEWLLPGFSNRTTVQSFTVVDTDTRRDLMTLTAGSVIDPARLGAKNMTLRANLDSAQGSVTLKYDAAVANLKDRPPFTAFGTSDTPFTPATLKPGAHKLIATPQFGIATTVAFQVAGNTSRVIAGYRSDFQPSSPASGWSYLWNALGSISSPANYRALNWSPGRGSYTATGQSAAPDPTALFPWGALSPLGGQTGSSASQGAVVDRFAIAAYFPKTTGYYALTQSSVGSTRGDSTGGRVLIYTEVGTTMTKKLSAIYLGGNSLSFNLNLGKLSPGNAIYVAVGPNNSDNNSTFNLDFSIAFKETGNPL